MTQSLCPRWQNKKLFIYLFIFYSTSSHVLHLILSILHPTYPLLLLLLLLKFRQERVRTLNQAGDPKNPTQRDRGRKKIEIK